MHLSTSFYQFEMTKNNVKSIKNIQIKKSYKLNKPKQIKFKH